MVSMTTHPNYDADDYQYLVAKGWTDQQILARWTEEAAEGKGPCQWTTPQAAAKLNATINRSTT